MRKIAAYIFGFAGPKKKELDKQNGGNVKAKI